LQSGCAAWARCGVWVLASEQHRCIRDRFDSGSLYRRDLQRGGQRATLDVPGPPTLGRHYLTIESALAGVGIAWVMESQVPERVAEGRREVVLPEWSPRLPGLCLYYPANRHPPTALRRLVSAIRDWQALPAADDPAI